MKHIAVLSFVIFCASCASLPWQKVPLPSKQFDLRGFSLASPDETGWWVNTRPGPDRLTLAKSNNDQDPYENYAIETYVLNVPAFNSDEDFLQAVKKGMGLYKYPNYKILKHDINLHKKNGENCALAQVVAETQGQTRMFGFGIHRRSGPMIYEMTELTCRHPQNNRIAINMIFSLMYYPGERDSLFSEKAMKVVDSVKFTDL